MKPGALLTLEVEKPAAGGRMLARYDGQVVLVWGAVPGERVEARVERAGKGVVYADTSRVLQRSPDRRESHPDWRCGGNVFAHVAYGRQLRLKAEIIQDAFGRIGRMPLSAAPDVVGSPERGYRMRARLHADAGRLGFYREGTHQICEPRHTGQLLEETESWIEEAARLLRSDHLTGLAAIEISENVAGNRRVCHLELHAGVDPAPYAKLGASLAGLSAQAADRPAPVRLGGEPVVRETLRVAGERAPLTLRRDVRAFFQGNRFLLETFVSHVLDRVPDGPVVDLYAGVGLFGLAAAARGASKVTLVEGDRISRADLLFNAEPFAGRVTVEPRSVEAFLNDTVRARPAFADASVIVDPPRTGMSRDALGATIANGPARIVYVSCDVPTLARDARGLVDAGYSLASLTAFDLFPNTAHVETVATFTRRVHR